MHNLICIVYIAGGGIVWDLFGPRRERRLNSSSGSICDNDLLLIPGTPLENVAGLRMGGVGQIMSEILFLNDLIELTSVKKVASFHT
jgi:hypothetical protein